MEISGYQITEKLHETSRKVIYRAVKDNGGSQPRSVIIKALKEEYPSSKDVAELRHEYEVTNNLAIEGILKSHELLEHNGSVALVMEDFGGKPLKTVIDSKAIDPALLLPLAVRLAEILGYIHAQNIVHRDIKPQNILINSETNQVKITDFCIASLSPRHEQGFAGINSLEGTLAYMAPEQAGRINRAVDYRSDFYSLGVVLYEMATGKRPFEAQDPLELVHSHVAKLPVSLHELNVKLPKALSRIIMKLLAKTPEERYQSAHGLKADLVRCLSGLTAGRDIDFEPGKNDRSTVLNVPQKLYGRQAEIAALKQYFDGCLEDAGKMALIAGYSGIGKTSLVRKAQRLRSSQKAYFISGKFDRLQRDIPYSGVIQAFKELLSRVLTESKAEVESWKVRILEAVGANGQIIVDVIPQVEHIIGPQKPAAVLFPAASQNRFNLVFQSFVGVFAKKRHPLILFLDDVQWADYAGIRLIELLTTSPDVKHLHFVIAYRDNEVHTAHPLRLTLDRLQKSNIKIRYINLAPLEQKHVAQIVAHTLECERQGCAPLARLIYAKTGGNPFLADELLRSLYQKGLVTFDSHKGRWAWDLEQIQKTGITENAAALMSGRIGSLSRAGQDAVKLAACIGTHFTLKTLAALNEKSRQATEEQLREAAAEGLVLPLSDDDNYAGEDNSVSVYVSFRFIHDLVQQAAYALLTEQEKQLLHLKIGKLMLAGAGDDLSDKSLCEIADHMNRGLVLITDQKQRCELAELNLSAGRKAKSSTAYESALRYLTTGLGLLPEAGWDEKYELTLSLHVQAAEAAYMSTDFSRAEALTRIVLDKAGTLLDRVKAFEIIIQSYCRKGEFKEAIGAAWRILKQLSVSLPTKPGRLNTLIGLLKAKLALRGKNIEDLSNLPEMTDPHKLAAMRILMTALPAFYAYAEMRDVLPVLACNMVALTVKYGNSFATSFAYTFYGLILGAMGDIEQGYQFGRLGVDLTRKYEAHEVSIRTNIIFFSLMRKWRATLKETLTPLLKTHQKAIDMGDFDFAALAIRMYCMVMFFSGRNLEATEQECAKYDKMLKRIGEQNQRYNIMLIKQVALNLTGRSEHRTRLTGESFNEEQMLPILIEADNTEVISGSRFMRCMLCFMFEDYRGAFENFQKLEKRHAKLARIGFVLEVQLYYSLVILAAYPELERRLQGRYMRKLASYQKTMRKWADQAPINYLHKWQLIEAERARVSKKDLKAMELYDLAISGAKENDYVQEEALANELAARFYLARGSAQIAAVYMQAARHCYQRWGALAKVSDLEERYGRLLGSATEARDEEAQTFPQSYAASAASAKALDLQAVLAAAGAISDEIVLGRLLERMMKTVIEAAGAEKGLLILEKDGRYCIEAARDAGGEESEVLQSIPYRASAKLPTGGHQLRAEDPRKCDLKRGSRIWAISKRAIHNSQPAKIVTVRTPVAPWCLEGGYLSGEQF